MKAEVRGAAFMWMSQGQNVTFNPSLKLKPAPPAAGLRYQNWKLFVAPIVIAPDPESNGGWVKSIARDTSPKTLTVCAPRRITGEAMQRQPSPNGCCACRSP